MSTGAAGWIPYVDALTKDSANIKAGAIVGADGEKHTPKIKYWAKTTPKKNNTTNQTNNKSNETLP